MFFSLTEYRDFQTASFGKLSFVKKPFSKEREFLFFEEFFQFSIQFFIIEFAYDFKILVD